LCTELGLGDELVRPAAFGAHLWLGRALRELPAGSVMGFPAGPALLLRRGLLSPTGAARALADLALPGPLEGPDVSVDAFVRRRFGREVLERLVDPVLAGTRAGHPDELGLAAAAPQIDAVARSYRSVMAGLRAERRAGRIAPGPPKFWGLRGGMQRLVDRLAEDLVRTEVRAGVAATGLRPSPGEGWSIDLGAGERLSADAAVLAVPAFAAARLVAGVSLGAAAELARIPYASVGLVSLVYPRGAGRLPPSGSGILVPGRAGRVLAGCTWTSRKWPHAAPGDGGLFIRCFIGRAGREPALDLDDDELARRAAAELGAALGLTGAPRARMVVRWDDAIPQYLVGHNERVEGVDAALAPWPTLALAGAGYRGSGLPDCIAQGEAAARRVMDALGASAAEARR
jgi:protoporphyrinogen/coproporphyrinogen III oxidase